MRKYRILLNYAARRRGFFLFILALTLAASAPMALHPWPMALVVDNVLRKEPLPGWLQAAFKALASSPAPASLLVVLVVGGLVLFTLSSAAEIGLTWAWTVGGRRMGDDLAVDRFDRFQRPC